MSSADLAMAAEHLVGSRFRLHGRDPASGLDCIGVLSAALAAIGRPVALPTGYALRVTRLDHWLPDARACGFAPVDAAALEPGDVILLACPGSQFHLAIAATHGFVHAHAGLRRVVLSPQCPDGTIIGHWRIGS